MPKETGGRGLRKFMIVLIGQLISVLGTGLTNFAIGVWVYRETGSVTKFSLTILAIALPSMLVAPLAGALVDRWDRRVTMIVGDSAAALCSLGLATLLFLDSLYLWHVVVIIAVAATANVFHALAYTATVPLLIPKDQLGRASGAMQIGPALAQVASPLLAGLLLAVMSMEVVLLVDVATFLFALISLIIVRMPRPETSAEGEMAKGSLLREVASGWTYVKQRAGLVWLLLFFTASNFTLAMSNVVLTPMLLGMASIEVVGTVASVASLGMLTGSIVLSVWGGPKRKVYGVLSFGVVLSLCLMLMGLRPSPVLIAIAGFGFVFAVPIIDGCSQAIWLSKTPPDIQGRVLSVRTMIGWGAAPLAYISAGPLADRFFEPLLAVDGALAGSVGAVLGVGPGRGMGLQLIALGMLMLIVTLVASASRRFTRLEDEIPDALPDTPSDSEGGSVEERQEAFVS